MSALKFSQHFTAIFQSSQARNSAVHGRISLNFKLITHLMAVLVTSKNEEDPIRNEGAGVFTTSFPL